SLLFGLLHIDPVRMAAATILGIALHAVYLATRSLLASMLLHASINAVCISAFKVWTAHQLNILGHFPDGQPPLSLIVASGVSVVAMGWALFRMRPQWKAPDGSLWTPGFVSAETPSLEASVTASPVRLGCPAAITLGVTLVAFVVAAIPGLRAARADLLA